MTRRALRLAAVAAILLPAAGHRTALAAPIFYGAAAVQYATVTNPFEIEFDPAGTLYAGHNTNSAVRVYRIPPGGGAAQLWGSQSPTDPDGIDVSGASVFASGEEKIWQTDRATGVTSPWTTWTANRNMTTMVVDDAGHYGAAGNIMIASARYSYDIEFISAATRDPYLRIASGNLYVPRGLLFAQGTLYCVESSASEGVWAVSPTGGLSAVDDGGFAWGSPQAMVYHPGGDVFYVGDGANIVRVPRTGGPAQKVGSGFGGIVGLTFGPDGRLYVADEGADVVWRVLPEPATLGLLGLGAAAALVRRRR